MTTTQLRQAATALLSRADVIAEKQTARACLAAIAACDRVDAAEARGEYKKIGTNVLRPVSESDICSEFHALQKEFELAFDHLEVAEVIDQLLYAAQA